VSLLSSNQLNIVLCPEQVFLQSVAQRMTLRGFDNSILGSETLAVKTSGEHFWSGALDALGSALPHVSAQGATACVVLSNHFVNYTLVPWCDGISDQDELAYAAHCFKEEFGNAAESWEVRVSPSRAPLAALASAVDTGLLGQLRELLGGAGIAIRSVQPHLMLAFNCNRNVLRRRNAWLALTEPGRLCLAMLHDGDICWVRTLRVGAAWHEELPGLLERESYLADSATDASEALLWAPLLEEAETVEEISPVLAHWNVRRLRSAGRFGSKRCAK
jgi:hypothetical protein